MFIVFEGTDGTGKTSYIKKLEEWLNTRGLDVISTRLPGGTILGQKIRELLFGEEVNTKILHRASSSLLYAADFLETQLKIIKPALEAGRIVLCDRWCISETAYNDGYDNYPDWHKRVIDTYLGLEIVPPDYIVFLTATPEVISKRLSNRANIDKKQEGKLWGNLEKLVNIQHKYETILSNDPRVLQFDTSNDHTIELWKDVAKATFPELYSME